LSILYAQTHKVATDYPDKQIEFTFYDDRLDILYGLKHFYHEHSDLLPKNLNLHLRIYRGNDIFNIGDIQGKGRIDTHYPRSIRNMAKLVTEEKTLTCDYKADMKHYIKLFYKEWNFAQHLKCDKLTVFKQLQDKNLSRSRKALGHV